MGDSSNGRDRLLTAEQVGEMYQVPKTWVYGRTRKRGSEKLPCVKLGKYVRFQQGAVEEYMEQHRVGAKTNA